MPSDEVSAAKIKNSITIWRMCWSKTLSSRFLRIISSMPIHIQATSCSTTCLKMIPSVMPWPMISTTKTAGPARNRNSKEHPLPPYRLVYLDFGMMGRLSPGLTDGIAQVVIALNTKSARRLVRQFLVSAIGPARLMSRNSIVSWPAFWPPISTRA